MCLGPLPYILNRLVDEDGVETNRVARRVGGGVVVVCSSSLIRGVFMRVFLFTLVFVLKKKEKLSISYFVPGRT